MTRKLALIRPYTLFRLHQLHLYSVVCMCLLLYNSFTCAISYFLPQTTVTAQSRSIRRILDSALWRDCYLPPLSSPKQPQSLHHLYNLVISKMLHKKFVKCFRFDYASLRMFVVTEPVHRQTFCSLSFLVPSSSSAICDLPFAPGLLRLDTLWTRVYSPYTHSPSTAPIPRMGSWCHCVGILQDSQLPFSHWRSRYSLPVPIDIPHSLPSPGPPGQCDVH